MTDICFLIFQRFGVPDETLAASVLFQAGIIDGCFLTKSSHSISLVCGVRGENERKEERDRSLVCLKAVVPNFFGTRDQFSGRQFFQGQRG